MIVIGIVIFIFVASYIYFISGLESIDKKRMNIRKRLTICRKNIRI